MLLGFIILIPIIVYVIYYLTKSRRPKLYYNPNGIVAKYVRKVSILKNVFWPTFWLANGHLQTIWGMRKRKTSKLVPERQTVEYKDGGNTIMDWFIPEGCDKGSDVVIINHTLGGGTREPCTNNLMATLYKQGYVVVVNNTRGGSGAKFTSAHISTGLDSDDTDVVVQIVKKRFSPRHIYMAGFSGGSYLTVEYITKYSEITAALAFSHTCNPVFAARYIDHGIAAKLYRPFMMSKLKHQVAKNDFVAADLKAAVKKAERLEDLDRLISAAEVGLNVDDYYKALMLKDKVGSVRCPLLMVMAEDDPFTDAKRFLPSEEAQSSENVAIARMAAGGHVSFLHGLAADSSLMDELATEWFRLFNEND